MSEIFNDPDKEIEEVAIESIDDKRLEQAQVVRERIIHALTSDDAKLKETLENTNGLPNVLLSALKDLSGDVLKKKKIAAEEKASDTNAAMIAQIALKLASDSKERNNSSDYMARQGEGIIPEPDVNNFRGANPVAGEMEQVENNTDVDSFMAIHGRAGKV